MMDRRKEFIEYAREFIGVPWVHQGRTERGVDCVGLVVLCSRKCGLDVPMSANYGRIQNYHQARTTLSQFCVRTGEAMIGDIVLYKDTQNLHVAIVSVIDGNDRPKKIIHANSEVGTVVESGLSFPPLMIWRVKDWLS